MVSYKLWPCELGQLTERMNRLEYTYFSVDVSKEDGIGGRVVESSPCDLLYI